MSIFDKFKRAPKDASEAVPAEGAVPEAPDAAASEGAVPEVEPPAAENETVAAADAGATMPLSLTEIEAAIASADTAAGQAAGVESAPDAVPSPEQLEVAAAAAIVPPEPLPVPSGPLAPERLIEPDDLPFLGRRAMIIPDRHGDPMESMGNIFDVAILLAVGFLVVSLSSFGLSDLLGKGDVTIVKNPGTKGMELVTKKNGVISRMRTTTQQAEGVGAAIGTVYKLENGEIVWVPGLPGAGRTTAPTPSNASSGTYTPPAGTTIPGQIGADGPTVAPTP